MAIAKYPGTCTRCNGRIETGDRVMFFNRPRPKSIFHAVCPDGAMPGTPTEDGGVGTPEAETTPRATGDLASIIADAVAQHLDLRTPAATVDEPALMAKVQTMFNRMLVEAQTPTIIHVDVTRSGGDPRRITGAHKSMPALLRVLGRRRHVYLWGPAGSGKSTAAKQAAEALGLDYGYISLNPQTPDSRLQGFIDANGVYRDPVFRRCYEHGGVFCIDEADNASGSLLTTMNSALENGHAAFPDGMVKRHPNFVLVATGNTAGLGANPAYPERRPFDAAFRDRFVYIAWGYDTAMERKAALDVNPDAAAWVAWVQQARRWAESNLPRLTITPRASIVGADLLLGGDFDPETVADMTVFKGLDRDSRGKVLTACPLPEAK